MHGNRGNAIKDELGQNSKVAGAPRVSPGGRIARPSLGDATRRPAMLRNGS